MFNLGDLNSVRACAVVSSMAWHWSEPGRACDDSRTRPSPFTWWLAWPRGAPSCLWVFDRGRDEGDPA